MGEPEMIDVYIRLENPPTVGDVYGVGPDDYEMICEDINPRVHIELTSTVILLRVMGALLDMFDMSRVRVNLVRGNTTTHRLEYTPPGIVKEGYTPKKSLSRYERPPVI